MLSEYIDLIIRKYVGIVKVNDKGMILSCLKITDNIVYPSTYS